MEDPYREHMNRMVRYALSYGEFASDCYDTPAAQPYRPKGPSGRKNKRLRAVFAAVAKLTDEQRERLAGLLGRNGGHP